MYLEKVNCLKDLPECESECGFCTKLLSAYDKLVKRHKRNITKNKRLLQLSRPKRYKGTSGPIPEDGKSRAYRRIIIVNKSDQLEHTRTEQLALPKVSQILELTRHPSYSSFHPLRKESVNLLMKRSMNSVYSCLSNVMFAPKSEQRRRQLKKNPNHIDDLAKPKRDFSLASDPLAMTIKANEIPSKVVKKKHKFLRTKELAKPRPRTSIPTNNWTLTDAIKSYEATERIKEMALPRRISLLFPKNASISGASRKKRHKSSANNASSRIAYLAKPLPTKMVQKVVDDNNVVRSKRKSLNVKLTSRLLELSSPRMYLETTIRSNPYGISKGALKAKASPRTKALARPSAMRSNLANKT